MNRPALFLLILLLGLQPMLQAAAAESVQKRDPYGYFFNDTFGDFQEELQTARDEGKKGIFLFFEMDECPFCHRMKNTVLNRSDVQDWFRERFLSFSVDVEGDIEIVDFQGNTMKQKDFAYRQFGVRATPVLLFFDLNGQPVARYTGATADWKEFLWLGEYVAEGAYKKQSFSRYKRARRKAEQP